MTPSDKQAFVANIEKQHGRRLRRFIASRLRSAAVDAADLAQEVFLRLLRIDHHFGCGHCAKTPHQSHADLTLVRLNVATFT